MAWIELHQTLPQNKKTLKLKRLLKIKTPQAVGHLCMLWLWALDNAPDGNLSEFPVEDIAEVCGVEEKNAQKFMDALAASGFVDENMMLHDWDAYVGKLINMREKNSERQKKYRKNKKKNDDALPLRNGNVTRDITVTSQEENTNNDCDITVTSRQRNGATKHNQTQPNTTNSVLTHTINAQARDGECVCNKPSLDEIKSFCKNQNISIDVDEFYDHYEANGWTIGKSPMRDWKAALRGWDRRKNKAASDGKRYKPTYDKSEIEHLLDDEMMDALEE